MNLAISILTEKLVALDAERAALVAVRVRKLFGCRPSAFRGRLAHHDKAASALIARHDDLERRLRGAVDEAKRTAMAAAAS